MPEKSVSSPRNHSLTTSRRQYALLLAAFASGVTSSRRSAAQPVDLVIRVELSEDRDQTGTLILQDGSGRRLGGPYPAFGRSDNATAKAHKNPARNPIQPYGDTPTGTYEIPRVVATGDETNYRSRSYGPNGALVLRPTAGQALTAAGNGRIGLMIHGGAPGSGGRLRATHGCVRLSDQDMARLTAAIAAAGQNARFSRCELVRLAASIGPPGDPVSGEDTGDPPPGIQELLNPGPIILP
ncbi:L,D-transpeptidase [Teichococcus coralli]|uniref:L,D-transpeptidase n=1 Tax=Teichococcus coralli TaxID=2545983 RepID=UPI0034625421